MRRVLAAFTLIAALSTGGAYAEDLTHCQAGAGHVSKAQWALARTEFKLCLASGKLAPKNAMAAHLNLSAVAFSEHKWPDVISEYDLAAKSGGASFKAEALPLYFRALAYAELNQLKLARASIDAAVAQAPKQPRLLMARMDILLALGEKDAALADGDALTKIPARDVEVIGHMRRAVIFEGMKRDDDALKEINAAAALDPKNLEIVQARMNLFAAQHQYDKALAEGATLAASPLQKWALSGRMARAELFHAKGQPNDALRELDAARKLAPNEPGVLLDHMTLLADMGQGDKALVESQTLVASKNPKVALIAHQFRGVVFDGQKRYPDALKEADAVLKIDAKDVTGLNNRCMALANLGRSLEAIATCQKGTALAPKSPMLWNSTGYAMEKAGRLSEAVSYYQKVADATPQNQSNQADLKRAQAALVASGAH